MGLHHKDVLREILGLPEKNGSRGSPFRSREGRACSKEVWRLIPKQIVEPKNGKRARKPGR